MFKKILITILVVIAVLFLIVLLIPDKWLESDLDAPAVTSSLADTSEGKGKGSKLSDGLLKDDKIEGSEDSSPSKESSKLRDLYDIRSTGAVRKQNVELQGGGEDQVTMLIYMNGSNLETDDGEATTDLSEIIAAGSSDKVNVLVQTMGTKKWHDYGIKANRSQIYFVDEDGLTLVNDDLGQLDCTRPDTLSDFIKWGVENYPADRYILQFWNHGGGPVYGFGYDEWNKDEEAALSIDEIQSALKDAGAYFDFIGMDCCIMATLETCCALYDFCDYLIVSEDFESGLGWSYKGMMKALYENSSIPTVDLAKIAIDDMVEANERDREYGDDSILTLIDESSMKVLFKTWKDFAYANEEELMAMNYSRPIQRTGRAHPILQNKSLLSDAVFSGWSYYADEESPEMSDYYITDIMSLAESIDSDESKALAAALEKTIVYSRASANDEGLTGLSVTLPYGDSTFYSQLSSVFLNAGIDEEYVDWLSGFVDDTAAYDFYDYDDWEDDWSGWDSYDEEFDWYDWGSDIDDDCWYCDDWYDDDEYDWWYY